MTRPIHTEADLSHHLAALAKRDTRLVPVLEAVDSIPLRRLPGGLAGLLRIVMGQQLSVHAAAAVWARLEAAAGTPMTCACLTALDDDALRAAGLSRQKVKTLRAVVASGIDGTLRDPPDDAALRDALIAVPGIGPWTADLYLLVCSGAPDVFPAGDLALRKAAGVALGHDDAPGIAQMEEIASAWTPHRSAAARLLWAYYRVAKGAPTTPTSASRVDDRAPV